MASTENRRKTLLKEVDSDPHTPTKVAQKRATRSSSRSKSRSRSCDTDESQPDATPSPTATTPSTRRSVRIAVRRSKRKSVHDSVDDDGDADSSEAKLSKDDEWEYDIPMKSYFNENPDNHVLEYSFKTPKKKDGMVTLAHNTPKRIIELKVTGTPKTPKTPRIQRTPKTPTRFSTPKTPQTPKSSRKLIEPKTPKTVRAKLHKGDLNVRILFTELLDEQIVFQV